MLLRFTLQNFLSFQKETSFDMFPNPKREELPHHTYTQLPIPLLKQAAIYGANSSGKSNFIKAIAFLQNLVCNSDFLQEDDFSSYTFRRYVESEDNEKKLPISLEIEFLYQQKGYIYRVEIYPKSLNESLYISGLGSFSDRLVFERKNTKVSGTPLTNETAVTQLLSRNLYASLLALNHKFPILNTPELEAVYQWFNSQLLVVNKQTTLSSLYASPLLTEPLCDFVSTMMDKAGLEIETVEIMDIPFETPLAKGQESEDELYFSQEDDQGGLTDFYYDDQSEGTIQLLRLLLALYQALQGKVVCFDVIDAQLHPALLAELIRYYVNNPEGGQLIFTTHCVSLLDTQDLLRPDEVWFTEKQQGNSRMYSLNDFKINDMPSLATAYLQGRFGGIPITNFT